MRIVRLLGVCGALLVGSLGCVSDAPVSPDAADGGALNGSGASSSSTATDGVPGGASTPTAPNGSSFVLRAGQSVQFNVASRQFRRFVQYTSLNPSVATVTGSGVITGVAEGETVVRGTLADVAVDAQVTVLPTLSEDATAVATFTLSPSSGVRLLPGAGQTFVVSAAAQDGRALVVPVTFSATGGSISPMGVFTAGQVAGTFMVVATCACGHADTTLVEVASVVQQSTLTMLTIAPKTATVETGGSLQLSTTARWSNGSTAVPPLTYRVVGSGTVNASGRYTAPGVAGTYRVIVAPDSGAIRDTAVITVQAAPSPEPPAPEAPAPPPPAAPTLAACPNLPRDHAVYGDISFSDLVTPSGWHIVGQDRELLGSPAAPYAPRSLGFKHELGKGDGQIGILRTVNFAAPPRSVYSCAVFMQSENFIQHPASTKFIYTPQMGSTTRPLSFNMQSAGSDKTNGMYTWVMFMQTRDPQRVRRDNVETVTMRTGRWYRLEMVAEMNTPGVPNGKVRWWTSVWADGRWSTPQLNGSYSDVLIADTSHPGTWRLWEYNLYYGGQGAPAVPADQYLIFNRVVIATRR
jgi:hypothetical protein